MPHYDVNTPSTLLLRAFAPEQARAALAMLEECVRAARPPGDGVRVFTLADVSSGPDVAPPAACLAVREADRPIVWVGRFAVAVPFRRRGLGRRLLDEVTTTMRAEGVRQLSLKVAANREPMMTLLRSSGFSVSSEHPAADACPVDLEVAGDGSPWWWAAREL